MRNKQSLTRKEDLVDERNLVFGVPEWAFAMAFLVAYLILLS